MKEFDSLSDLIGAVELDGQNDDRFPVRLILVNSLSDWRAVVSWLENHVDKVVRLSDLCAAEDLCPRWDDVSAQADVTDGETVLILPLAEVLRLFPSGKGFLCNLVAMQTPGKGRIYVPLLDLEDLVLEVSSRSARLAAGAGSQVWRLSGGKGEVDLTVVPFPLPGAKTGMREYLRLWESGGQERTVLNTAFAAAIRDRASRFRVRVYPSAFSYARDRLRLPPQTEERWGTPEQWQWLAGVCGNETSLSAVAEAELNVARFDAAHLFTGWRTLDENHRWLLFVWSKLQAPADTYLAMALDSTPSSADLVDALWCAVLGRRLTIPQLRERRQLLGHLGASNPPAAFWRAYGDITDPAEKVSVLAGLSTAEQDEIIRTVGHLISEGRPREDWFPVLELTYPDLASYLSSFPYPDTGLRRYFGLYAESRVCDRPLEGLLAEADRVAQTRRLWEYPPRHAELENLRGQSRGFVWVDAVGIEWAGVLHDLLCQCGYDASLQVVRCNLPTATEFNKGWADDARVERRLDDIAHHYEYQFPASLRQELGVMHQIVERVQAVLQEYEVVVLTSDHGLTRFAGAKPKIPVPDGYEVRRGGRYAVRVPGEPSEVVAADELLVEDDKLIVAVHSLFEGVAEPRGEAHGGACLEEALVPILVVRRPTKRRPVTFRLLESRIRLNIKSEGRLAGEVDPSVSDLTLTVAGRSFIGAREGDNRWVFTVSGLKPDHYTGNVTSEGAKIADIEFDLVRGLVVDDLGL